MVLKSMISFLEFAIEEALEAADTCVDMVTTAMDMITDSGWNVEYSPRDLPPYPKPDYSTRDPETWTGEEICQRIWLQMCLSPTENQQHRHFETLSRMQGMISFDGDDEAWFDFLDDTPGLRAYIKDFAEKYNDEF